MKIILLKNVDSLGQTGEVKEVADGHARNFLIPNGLAEIATDDNIKRVEVEKEQVKKAAERDLVATEKLAEKLQGMSVEIAGKVSDAGTLYAAITPAKIVGALKQLGVEVKAGQVMLPEPIKEAGEHSVAISLEHGLETEVMVMVTEQ